MQNEKSKLIDDYYDLCGLVNNNVVVACLLLQICNLRIDSKMLNELSDLKIEKHALNLQSVLGLRVGSIKDLKSILEPLAIDYELQRQVKKVDSSVSLIDFIEGDI